MTRYFSGYSVDELNVKHGDKEQKVIIGMTEDERKDQSYVDYLRESITEKTKDEMVKYKKEEPKKGSREHLRELLKEKSEYDIRKAENPNRKYWFT